MYKREPGFKLNLSGMFEFLPPENDLLNSQPKLFFARKLLRNQFLSIQSAAKTEHLVKFANGRNVVASFERIRREIEDLQFVANYQSYQKKPITFPIASFESTNNSIKFVSKRGNREVTMVLTLCEQPPSAVNRDRMPTGHFIKVQIDRKIEDSIKFADVFGRSLAGGELFIDFITNKLWPELDKPENRISSPRVKNLELRTAPKAPKAPEPPLSPLMDIQFSNGPPGRRNDRNDRGSRIPRQPLGRANEGTGNFRMPAMDVRKERNYSGSNGSRHEPQNSGSGSGFRRRGGEPRGNREQHWRNAPGQ